MKDFQHMRVARFGIFQPEKPSTPSTEEREY
jgi:hypothetical protein